MSLSAVIALLVARPLLLSAMLTAMFLASTLAKGCSAQNTTPLDHSLNETIVMIPAQAHPVTWLVQQAQSSGADSSDTHEKISSIMYAPKQSGELETTVFMPPGEGPFPLLILNHGKALGDPHLQERARFLNISRQFIKRGYAVIIPMRTGFSQSSGSYVEQHCDMTANAYNQASDLYAVLAYATKQSWVDSERIVIGGQSYGGLAALAFATHDYPGLKGVLNFAGGLRTEDCEWQNSLVQAFTSFGQQSRIPSLWFYGKNDRHFNHVLADKLHHAYTAAGGKARLIKFGDFKHDAHGMGGSRDGVNIWWPETEKFLQSIDMPTVEIFQIAEASTLPASGFAALDDSAAVPYLQEQGREQYRVFLEKSFPRAFALSPTGAWSWVEDGDDPAAKALDNCQKNSTLACQLYAIDERVVWQEQS